MDHPSRDQLQRLLEGQLDQPAYAAIAAHLQGCTQCQGAMDELTRANYPKAMPRDTPGEAERAPDKNYPRWFEPAQQPAAAKGQRTADGGGEPPSPAGQASAGACPAITGYEILGELDRGGMGVVYKARQVGLGRVVALKMILAGEYAGPDDVARFRHEAAAAAQLQHPNIVQIHEIGEQDGRPFFAMEFVDGGSLKKKLDGTPLPARRAAQLLETLARAVHHAHESGVIHRDLKPANILLASGGRQPSDDGEPSGDLRLPLAWDEYTPKVTDFGLAKRLDSQLGQTQSGAIMGTAPYMAPEQAAGESKHVGPASDVHALGAILYELLTGRPPFQASSLLETLEQVRFQEPVPPSHLQPKLPRDLETICLKCLQKEPSKRYASARDLADDLRRFRQDKPILAKPIRVWERGWKWARRRPAVAGLLAMLTMAVSGGFLGMAMLWLRAEHQRKQALEFQAELARSYFESNRLLNRLGFVEAVNPGKQARAMFEKLVQAHPTSSEFQILLASTLHNLGDTYRHGSQYKNAQECYEQHCALWEKLLEKDPENSQYESNLAGGYQALGEAQRLDGQEEAGLRSYERARTILEKLKGKGSLSGVSLRLAQTYLSLGLLHHKQWQDSWRFCNLARGELEKLIKDNPGNQDNRSLLSQTLRYSARALLHKGNLEDARQIFQQAVNQQREVLDKAPENFQYRRELLWDYRELTGVLFQLGELAEAAKWTLEWRKLVRGDPEYLYEVACDLARCIKGLGEGKITLTSEGQARVQEYAEEAMKALRQAVDNGFKNGERMKKDEVLKPLRDQGDFQELINKLEKMPKPGAGQ